MIRSLTALTWITLIIGAFLVAPRALSVWRDRPANDLLTVILRNEKTIYNDSYSEKAFQKVELGMTELQVKRSLGQPLRIVETSGGRIKRMVVFSGVAEKIPYPDLPQNAHAETEEIGYYYSQPENATSDWHVRAITFTPDGIVKGVVKKFYVD